MDEYIVSARKYRPMSFDSVVGQKALTTTLKNAVKSGKLAHAYLFCGPRGVGKTTCARIFAKAINCENPQADGEACNQCESCKAFNEQRSYNIFELDAASNNSVENIKTLMEQTRIPPQVGRYKVFIIDEVHMLSTAAFNAFLKTLEEPPAHVIFILATTEKHKILPTILSRCQIYDFERMSVGNTIAHLKMVAQKEGIQVDDKALAVIAEKADGGMRDALSIFDQAASFSQGNLTYEKVIEDLNVLDEDNYFNLVDFALENKVTDAMLLLNGILSKGFDGGHLISGLANHIRNVLMANDEQTLPLLETSQEQQIKYREQAKRCKVTFLYKALKLLNACDLSYKLSTNKRLLVELTLIQIAQITQPEDDTAGVGRSPKQLKSLFQNLIKTQPTQAAQQVAAVEPTELPTQKEVPHQHITIAKPTLQTIQPAATPNATIASPQPTIKLDDLTMSFRKIKDQANKPIETTNTEIEVDKTAQGQFTQDDLARVWLQMLMRMPQHMQGLAARLKNVKPKLTIFPNIEIVFDNEILLQQIDNIRPRIKATLARDLKNGQLNITWRVAQANEVKPLLTKREQFEQLKKENTAFHLLCQSLNLDLT